MKVTGRAFIQFQDQSGSWRTINECDADDVTLRVRLDDALRAYRTRVRAISKETGAVLDIRIA